MKSSIILFLLCLCEVFSHEQTKLLLVQMVVRHGDRTPYASYPNNPNPANVWNEGFGSLTKTGKQQLWTLGKYFRVMYDDFMTTNPNEIYVTSSSYERCLISAESFLASFFAPKPAHVFQDNVLWQPIAVHYPDKDRNKLLVYLSDCPRAIEEFKRLNTDSAFKEEYREMIDIVSRHAGMPSDTLLTFGTVWDSIKVEKLYEKERNLVIPKWVEPYWEKMDAIGSTIVPRMLNSTTVLRLRTGPLLEDLIKNMKSKIEDESNDKKFYVYSGHDYSIIGLLAVFGRYNDMGLPLYASTLVFELHQMVDGSMAVRILYQNSPNVLDGIDEPIPVVLEGCSEYCPLEHFIDATRKWIPENYEKECKIEKTGMDFRHHSNAAVCLHEPFWWMAFKVLRF